MVPDTFDNTTSIDDLNDHQNGRSSSNEDADGLANILPSYYMYQYTLSRSVHLNHDFPDDSLDSVEPPNYVHSSVSPLESSENMIQMSNINSPTDTSSPLSDVAQDVPASANGYDYFRNGQTNSRFNSITTYTRWEDTILANTASLRRLRTVKPSITRDLEIQIYFTEKVGKVGVEPNILKAENIRLQQGQYLYGFITIINKTNCNIPFDMFAVLLEGTIQLAVDDDKRAIPIKFLNMFDFNASWCDGTLDRFQSENNDPHKPLVNDLDPLDNTYIQLNKDKVFLPGVKYKKYFAFKLPEKLLDYSCESHSFIKHLQLLPSMGVPPPGTVGNKRKKKVDDFDLINLASDFAFPNSGVSYSVSARVIGKSHNYKCLGYKSKKEEYIIVNEEHAFVRVTPHDHPLFILNRSMIHEEARLMYVNKINKIEEIIETYLFLRNRPEFQEDIEAINSSSTELNKLKQSYCHNFNYEPSRNHFYEVFVPYNDKKSMFTSTRPKGLLTASTPKREYYIEPKVHENIRDLKPSKNTQINIPIKLSCMVQNEKCKLPQFEEISADLVAVTVKSRDQPIPLVFHADAFFENSSKPNDDFDHLVIKKFQVYARKFSFILKNSSKDIRVEKSLIRDIKALANLKAASTKLKITKPQTLTANETCDINSTLWTREVSANTEYTNTNNHKFSKLFDVQVDIANCVSKKQESTNFRLIPDFQHCFMTRFYYIKLSFKTATANTLSLKVPVTLQHPYKLVP